MKPFLTIALLLFARIVLAQPQPVEVLMIGTSHSYSVPGPEHFAALIDKAAAFRPDAVFGEYLSAEDYDAIPDYWNKAAMQKRYAYMTGINYAMPRNLGAFIRNSVTLLADHPNYHQDRMKLARAYYLTHDYGNARYQLYRLDKARPAFGAEEVAAYRTILGPPDSLYSTVSRTSEYHNIAFPLIEKLGLPGILPMDSQRHDTKWGAAWDKADSLVKKWEAGLDSTSADGLRYKALNKRTKTLETAMNQAETAGEGTVFFNAPDGDEYLNIVNFYGARRMFGAKGFPETALNAMLAEWQNRNTDMVRNTVERARKAGAKRVVVFAGANHRKIMVDGFRAMPGVTVRELNSL
jgi:Family of unknown function (DUF5694)